MINGASIIQVRAAHSAMAVIILARSAPMGGRRGTEAGPVAREHGDAEALRFDSLAPTAT
jgi:hypothetical protein